MRGGDLASAGRPKRCRATVCDVAHPLARPAQRRACLCTLLHEQGHEDQQEETGGTNSGDHHCTFVKPWGALLGISKKKSRSVDGEVVVGIAF